MTPVPSGAGEIELTYHFFLLLSQSLPSHSLSTTPATMITHETLYSLANTLGALAMCTVVIYHFIAVNAKYVTSSPAA